MTFVISGLLVLVHIILLSVSLVRSKFDFIYPPVLYFGTWTLASIGYFLMSSYWEAPIHSNTFFVIAIGGLLFFCGCECTSWYLRIKHVRIKRIVRIRINRFYLRLFFLFELLSLGYIFSHQYGLAVSVNSSLGRTDIGKILEYARYATVHGGLSNKRLYVNVIRILYVLSLVLFYDYLRNKNIRKRSVSLFELFQCILIPLITLLAAVRIYIFGILSGYIVIYLGLRKHDFGHFSLQQVFGVIRKLVLIAALFVIGFGFLNVTVLSRLEDNRLIEIVSYTMKYVSSSIPALDYFINNRELFGYSYFGASTFQSIYVSLKSLNLIQQDVFQTFLPFTPTMGHGFSTNVYSIYFQYVYDFGYFGVVMNIINGMIYGVLYNLTNKKKNAKALLLYALMSLPITMSFFAEYLWSMINTHIIRIVILLIFYVFIEDSAYSFEWSSVIRTKNRSN